MTDPLYLDIVFSLNIDKTLQYRCPPGLVQKARPGMRVTAPLNRRPQPGIILSTGTLPKIQKVLDIRDIPDDQVVLDGHQLSLLDWVSRQYLTSPGRVLKAFLPRTVLHEGFHLPAGGEGGLFVEPAPDPPILQGRPLTEKQKAILAALSGEGGLPAADLIRRTGSEYRTLHGLEKRGLILLTRRELHMMKSSIPKWSQQRIDLTEMQKETAGVIGKYVREGLFRRIILHGPPASGKMEVFLRVVEESLPPSAQALILVPELSLTPPLITRLEEIYPGERVVVFHSRLSSRQRQRNWILCRRGEARVVIGSRSAAFTPLPKPGLLVLDEEHEPTYKSEESPRYHAREVVCERGRQAKVPVILSSATPSLESLAAISDEETLHLRLPPLEGVRGRIRIRSVDLKKEKGPKRSILSGPMRSALKKTLSRNEKAVFFVNRRGLASAAFCRDCFFTPRCTGCSTPLAYHREDGLMICRLCGHREMIFSACPRCQGNLLHLGSPGTRGVEKEVRLSFPQARTGLMDRDSISRQGYLEKILEDFDGDRINVLIGTQLLTRGFHWPGVSLVGIVDADISLQRTDFRASERTFQLLSQVTGRAGWGVPEGTVIIQTHHPEHYAIQAILRNSPDHFYHHESLLRKEIGFPPFGHLILLVLEDVDQKVLSENARILREAMEEALWRLAGVQRPGDLEILGPHIAPLFRKRGRHRKQILLKGPEAGALRQIVREATESARLSLHRSRGKLSVDVDPVDFL
jgi:primosomal protein N' (replication factor Y)